MTREDYLTHQFVTLRREIEGQQIRVFWIIMIGLLGMPAVGYFLLAATTPVWLVLPFFCIGGALAAASWPIWSIRANPWTCPVRSSPAIPIRCGRWSPLASTTACSPARTTS